MNVSHKLAEAMYAKTAGGQGGPGARWPEHSSRQVINSRHPAKKMTM